MKKRICLILMSFLILVSQNAFAQQIFNAALMTPKENVFRIEGYDNEFILLDEDKGKFFVMAKDYYGKHCYNSAGREKFDAKDIKSVAYWLNNDFLTMGYTGYSLENIIFPKEVLNYIEKNHEWDCAGGTTFGNAPKPYKATCGIALLSENELVKYASKIGLDDNITSLTNDILIGGWILRDVNPATGQPYVVRTALATDRCYTWNAQEGSVAVRPVFWLDEDFFKNVKLNLIYTGENVLKVFKERYTISELEGLYTKSQLYDYFKYTPPVSIKILSDGKEIKDFKTGEIINAEITLKNVIKADVKGMLMVTGYDNLGAALYTKAYPMCIKTKEVEKKSIEISDEGTASEYIRISFLEGLPNCKTVSNSIRITK